jgi:hypothetical protein
MVMFAETFIMWRPTDRYFPVLVDTDNITQWVQRENAQITDKSIYGHFI